MQLGMIGLGRMGANMVRRLLKGGHECVVFDMSPKAVAELVKEKAVGTGSLAEFVKTLSKPRAVTSAVVHRRGQPHAVRRGGAEFQYVGPGRGRFARVPE